MCQSTISLTHIHTLRAIWKYQSAYSGCLCAGRSCKLHAHRAEPGFKPQRGKCTKPLSLYYTFLYTHTHTQSNLFLCKRFQFLNPLPVFSICYRILSYFFFFTPISDPHFCCCCCCCFRPVNVLSIRSVPSIIYNIRISKFHIIYCSYLHIQNDH